MNTRDQEIVHFLSGEEIFGPAQEIFDREKKFIEENIDIDSVDSNNLDIQHVGSASIPGVLGKFDVDIQIRVNLEDFEKVVVFMKKYFPIKHENIETNEFALFKHVENSPVHIDYMVTVKESQYDDFYKVRDYLIEHPDVLNQYIELKKQYEGKTYLEYRKAKQQFFGGIKPAQWKSKIS